MIISFHFSHSLTTVSSYQILKLGKEPSEQNHYVINICVCLLKLFNSTLFKPQLLRQL